MLVFEATFNLTLLINTSFPGINLLSLTIYYAYTHALLTSRLVAILSDETTSPVNVVETFLFFVFCSYSYRQKIERFDEVNISTITL